MTIRFLLILFSCLLLLSSYPPPIKILLLRTPTYNLNHLHRSNFIVCHISCTGIIFHAYCGKYTSGADARGKSPSTPSKAFPFGVIYHISSHLTAARHSWGRPSCWDPLSPDQGPPEESASNTKVPKERSRTSTRRQDTSHLSAPTKSAHTAIVEFSSFNIISMLQLSSSYSAAGLCTQIVTFYFAQHRIEPYVNI